jgi:phosphatidylglycerophosphate synthase
MFDRRLRSVSARVFDPLAAGRLGVGDPMAIGAVGLALGLGAAALAAVELAWPALVLWIANRVADGLDGAVARARGRVSDAGGYADICADVLVYAAIPLGVAVGRDDRATWIAAAALLAAFYVNTISWTYLAALLERRALGSSASGEPTSITMPVGLVEGAETIIWFTLLLAVPGLAPWWMATMAAATALGATARFAIGFRRLAEPDRVLR